MQKPKQAFFYYHKTKCLLIVIGLLSSFFPYAQNLIVNSNFSQGTTGWNAPCSMEVYPETAYGGPDASKNVTEIDRERCINQKICVMDNTTYVISLNTTRRPDPNNTPPTVGFIMQVQGLSTNTFYIIDTTIRTNTTWALTPETYTFTIPSGSADKYVQIAFYPYNSTATYGIILDDIEMHPQTDMSISGVISTSLQNTIYYYSVTNAPTDVLYNWSFDAGSTPSTSTYAYPSTSWGTSGAKNLSVTISNGTCPVATLNSSLVITGVLPIKITGFSGNVVNDKAVLDWTTADEENINHFVIERSADGVHYESVALVFSENTPGTHKYSYPDTKYTSPAYYRIREVDANGNSSYSQVVILKKAINSFAVTLYPSFTNTTLHYSVAATQPAGSVLQVVDAAGQTVITGKINLFTGENAQALDVSLLTRGLYFLKLSVPANGATATKQFWKL